MPVQSAPPAGRISGPNPAFEDAELVFGLVAPVGTNFTTFEDVLTRKLGRHHYSVSSIRMSQLMARFDPTPADGTGSAEFVRLTQRMHEGSFLRLRSRKGEFLALAAASEILARRKGEGFQKRTAHVVRSLKHPDEVRALRRIYGPGFFLIVTVRPGLLAPAGKRRKS